jgi:deazaflavin-dependent oxidoreductase (nitroreductase family)
MTQSNNSKNSWIQDHLTKYIQTNGEDGHIWKGMPTLLLTTTGRVSGQFHTTPLIYGKFEKKVLIVASRGGAPTHPQWYLNILDSPKIEIQILSDKFHAIARTATQDEKPELWNIMTEIFPMYNNYQLKTDRIIPLVIIERISEL